MITSSRPAGSTAARVKASRITTAPRSAAETSLRDRPNAPIGVRQALTITDSGSTGHRSIVLLARSAPPADSPYSASVSSDKIAPMSGDTFEFGGEIAWRPTAETVAGSRLTAFMRRHGIADLATLLERSVADPDWFWRAVLDDLAIEFYEPYTHVLEPRAAPPGPSWCVGGRLNIVHNCLDKWTGTASRWPRGHPLGGRGRRRAAR